MVFNNVGWTQMGAHRMAAAPWLPMSDISGRTEPAFALPAFLPALLADSTQIGQIGELIFAPRVSGGCTGAFQRAGWVLWVLAEKGYWERRGTGWAMGIGGYWDGCSREVTHTGTVVLQTWTNLFLQCNRRCVTVALYIQDCRVRVHGGG